jgi:hypothetical protein
MSINNNKWFKQSRHIDKAKYGTIDKIREETEELEDAIYNSSYIHQLMEAADVMGSVICLKIPGILIFSPFILVIAYIKIIRKSIHRSKINF